MNKLTYIAWHMLASIFIFGVGGLCFKFLPNSTLLLATTLFFLTCILGVLWLSLCTVDTKKDQQR